MVMKGPPTKKLKTAVDVSVMPPSVSRILVVDDEEAILATLAGFIKHMGFEVEVTTNSFDALKRVKEKAFDLVLLDLVMPDLDGIETLRSLKMIDASISVLIMTGYGTIQTAVEAMKRGADDYLIKPVLYETLLMTIERLREHRQLKEECRRLREQVECTGYQGELVARSKKMEGVLELIRKVAPLRSTVLIQGESGTGKERVARAIHSGSPRSKNRFVAINCGVIPIHLLESELFGYERGAFTGAESRKLGYFEVANEGTIFLDEISEMEVELQVKLLRVLQERTFQRIGGTDEIATDVRVISSSNRNLEEEMAEKRFRKDLFYRLNVIRIEMPPLRERVEDIAPLSYHFLRKFATEVGKAVRSIAPSAMQRFYAYQWDGNIRELENVIERAVAVCEGDEITEHDLPASLLQLGAARQRTANVKPFDSAKRDFEREYFIGVLQEAGGNMSLAARIANLTRQHLYEKIGCYGLNPDTFR